MRRYVPQRAGESLPTRVMHTHDSGATEPQPSRRLRIFVAIVVVVVWALLLRTAYADDYIAPSPDSWHELGLPYCSPGSYHDYKTARNEPCVSNGSNPGMGYWCYGQPRPWQYKHHSRYDGFVGEYPGDTDEYTGCPLDQDGLGVYVSYSPKVCPDNYKLVSDPDLGLICKRTGPDPRKQPYDCTTGSPTAGNPINVALGLKVQSETDYAGKSLTFKRYYSSINAVDWAAKAFMGRMWRHSFNRSVVQWSSNGDIKTAAVYRANGRRLFFNQNADGSWRGDPDVAGQLRSLVDGGGAFSGWEYRPGDGTTEQYDSNGRLLSILYRNGKEIQLSYNAEGLVDVATTSHGESLQFNYDDRHRLVALDTPDGAVSYGYDARDQLATVTYPDSTPSDTSDNHRLVHHYDSDVAHRLLTSITNEDGVTIAKWEYDSKGRAISSQHANGADLTTIDYGTDGSRTVTNSLGRQTTYYFTTVQGVRKVTRVEGHPTANCAAANRRYMYTPEGWLASKTDWQGHTTTYEYNARGLVIRRVEAAGTPQERVTTKTWDPDYRLPARITEPERIIDYTYDADGRLLTKQISARN